MEGLAIGRIVHYSQESSTHASEQCRAAIITHVFTDDGLVNLYVFPDGITEEGGIRTSIPYQREQADPCWHWPGRT